MARHNNTDNIPIFQGFRSPNYTMVPDEVFDELLPDLSGAELKLLLYIIRRTFGFKRDADSISLSQMLYGITTRDERVLDRGVGISKPTLLQALRSLEEKHIIDTQRQRSPDKGDEPTVYSLKFANDTGGKKTLPPVVKKLDQGGGQKTLPGPWSENFTTQYTVLQETVKQENDDDIAAHLEKFGVSKAQAQRISTNYAPELIMEKLDLVQYLESVKSTLVARNPQGFLVRAIDENYLPTKIKGYRSKAEREQEEQDRKQEEEEIERAQQTRQKAITSFIQNRAEAQIPRTKLTTKTAWAQTLDLLQKDISSANFNMWLRMTLMVNCQNGQALIGAPSSYVADWLQARMRSRVANALSNVIGRRVEVEFEAVPEMTRGDANEGGSGIVDE